jgi:signal transduction histidine kinase
MSRALAPIAAALLGLAGSLGATLALHRVASAALDRVLEERLRGVGETSVRFLVDGRDAPGRLRAVMEANRLEGAYLVTPALQIAADATGPAGGEADLLRVDAARVERAFRGEITVAPGYDVGGVRIESAYFPVRGADGGVDRVLGLEAGEAFTSARRDLGRAFAVAVALSAVGAAALAVAAARWTAAERQRRAAAARAARGDAVAGMAAVVAHEIRNPLGIIQGSVDLLRERAGGALDPRAQARLDDVLGEVERLRRLTHDFLELAAEPPLGEGRFDVREVAEEAARGSAALHPALEVRVAAEAPLPVRGDAGRMRQVLANLLANASQAGSRHVEIRCERASEAVRIEIADDGPGVDRALASRLFEPFATGREGGTGLGLALSRRIVERHGGTLSLVSGTPPGATFEILLPSAEEAGAWRGS